MIPPTGDERVVPPLLCSRPTRDRRDGREAPGQGETRVPRHPGRTIATGRHGEGGEREKREAGGHDTPFPPGEIMAGGRAAASRRKLPVNRKKKKLN